MQYALHFSDRTEIRARATRALISMVLKLWLPASMRPFDGKVFPLAKHWLSRVQPSRF
jgi:hypothetical protein